MPSIRTGINLFFIERVSEKIESLSQELKNGNPSPFRQNSFFGEPTITTFYKGNYFGLTFGVLIGGGKNKRKTNSELYP
jgi:hypothetical protein